MGKIRSIPDPVSINKRMKIAIENEARRMVAEQAYSMARDLTAIVLYCLSKKHGWGKKRLTDFYQSIMPLAQDLKDHYEMQDAEAAPFLCTDYLRDVCGIDMDTIDFSDKIKVNIED